MNARQLLRKKGTDFMNSNSKKGNGVLYLTLVLIIAAILCITIFPFFGRRNQTPDVPDSTATESNAQAIDTTSPPIVTNKPVEEVDLPVDNETSDTEPEETDAVSPTGGVTVTRFSRPAEGYVTKAFDRDTLVYSLTMNDYRVHLGIDIAASLGDAVSAFADGTILYVYDDPMNGRAITIDHGEGLLSHYFNLAADIPEDIYEGALVHCGQTIGSVGDTTLIELSDENHLHFELTLNGEYIDPLEFVEYEHATAAANADMEYED